MAFSESLGSAHVLSLDIGAIAYRDTGGTGRPVLFVHGVLVNADVWRAVVPALAPHFRCVAPDWPLGSHEFAMNAHASLTPPGLAAAIGQTLERLDLRDAIVVASDTGAALVQIALAHHAERIGAVVLTNGDAFEHFFPAALAPLPLLVRLPGFVRGLSSVLETPRGGSILARTIAHARPTPAVLRSYLSPMQNREVRRDFAKAIAAVEPAHTLEAARHFGDFTKPVAVGWGDDDLFFSPALGARLAGAFPNASLRRIPRSRTLVPEDAPDAVAELVRDVAARLS